MPSAAAREVITAPPTLASDLLKAIVTASTRSRTPACSAAPRPSAPSTPSPCASSTDEPGAEPVAERGDPGERRELTGHGVDAVDDDHRAGPLLGPFQSRGERREVVVPEPAHGAAPAAAPACTLACACASTSNTSPGLPIVDSRATFALIPDDVSTAASVP